MPARRNRRAGVEDLWTKEERDQDGNVRRVPSKLHGKESAGAHATSMTPAANRPNDSHGKPMHHPGSTRRFPHSSRALTCPLVTHSEPFGSGRNSG